jgi:hypothetical protein
MLSLLGKRVHRAGAIIAGLGFGTFIDELGKFITSNNNYFFQPSIALIYIIFMVLFIVFRAIESTRAPTQQEYLANAVEIVRESVMRRLDEAQKNRAMDYLRLAGSESPVADALRSALSQIDAVPDRKRPAVTRIIDGLSRFYLSLVRTTWYPRLLIAAFAVYVVWQIGSLVGVIVNDPDFRRHDWALSFADVGMAASSAVAAALLIIGLVRLRRSRLDAYHWFKRAILVSIFLIQVFAFYSEQLLALIGLVRDILILIALNSMIRAEQSKSGGTAAEEAPVIRAREAPLPGSGL